MFSILTFIRRPTRKRGGDLTCEEKKRRKEKEQRRKETREQCEARLLSQR